ncbi:MAG: ATP-grasp domain-containing protein [Candidatus Hydrogenedentes bacterium]|nr:ATP-grasp domain-containing protein [Candidatus Hydrogenedentota bacterium]
MSQRFSTVLVANRGEIACRILRTARHQGYRTVAVYSDADANALHTRCAGEAIRLGGPQLAESYLNAARILEIASAIPGCAIHPGYGFLSENAAFAQACADAGVIFIGPPPGAITLMGNKGEAKREMLKAGVPCVPGYEDPNQDDAVLLRAAEKIGFPVLLKATAGGGGRGMRRVPSEEAFASALSEARTEAANAFGSPELIIEKLVENARHIEVQVMADTHGNCIHLGERDCSVQRRHQKVIEEAPAPGLSQKLRDALGAAAVAAAKASSYVNAGTVEFLVEDSGDFYFLEMNTRLQVEHPVTELVTGLDLVAIQLAVAQGEALPVAQSDVQLRGHAIEARLYAENPLQGFAPQTGTVVHWHPATGEGIRIDHGLADGYEITPFYDAMLAKLIAWGPTRDVARERLLAAIRNSHAFGVETNSAFLGHIVAHRVFAEGNAKTSFLDTSGLLDAEPVKPSRDALLLAASVLIERDSAALHTTLKGWRSTGRAIVPVKLAFGDEVHALDVTMLGDEFGLRDDNGESILFVECIEGDTLRYRENGALKTCRFAVSGPHLFLAFEGHVLHFEDITYAPPKSADAGGGGVLRAPMIGQVVELLVAQGDRVAEGQVLLVLEAMKMVNQIIAPAAGVVASLNVGVGDRVLTNGILLTLATDEA